MANEASRDEATATTTRNSQMKWSGEHDVMLGREIMLFELWKYKAGSRERGQCLDRIAESLNHLERPSFSVSQKSVRDRLKILERDFKKKERSEKNASGISPERTEVDQIMEDYLEQKEDQERESEKASEESRDKMAKEKATAEDMRNKAMERLSETKKRAGSDLPKKKRKNNGNDTLEYLKEASDRECELKKQELEFKMQQEKSAAAQQTLMLQQMKNQQEQFQTMLQMFMQQQQTQSHALLELLKKRN
ncbi:caldesmon-like [Acropora muricata]|uniref:caldesmon-like n=1 Tax=Acropora muricata TaxID=159855 RepID=UPI0034E4E446